MPPRFSRPKLSGSVTVRRLQVPQLETDADIRKGELVESLEAVSLRIGLSCASDSDGQSADLCLVDEQGLALMGKMLDKGVYYVSGGFSVPVSGADTVVTRASNVSCDLTAPGSPQQPDCAVLWAFDPRMLLHRPFENRSPETPYRLQRALEALQQCERARDILPKELLTPLLFQMDGSAVPNPQTSSPTPSVENCARWVPARFATLEEICSFHEPETYRDFIENGAALTSLKSDVYCNEETSSAAARLSVGAVIDACASVLDGVASARINGALSHTDSPLLAYCLVRPPGHHCTTSQPSGFCLVNNVAVAVTQLRTHRASILPTGVPRIAVLDLDVHFGEGTASFAEDVGDSETLLYLSLHRYDQKKFYPFDQRGDSAYVGGEAGGQRSKGCICNVAVHTDASNPSFCEQVISDHLMNEVLERIFLPRLEKFRPDVVIVSLGFDAAYGDPLGKMAVEGGFASVVARLKRWCTQENRVTGLVVVLEGGYNPSSVAQGVLSVGLALTLPESDSTVQAHTQEHPPRVWGDLRQRQERQLREWQLAQKERAEVDAAEERTGVARDGRREIPPQPALVPDDTALLVRHRQWCASLIETVKHIHCTALCGGDVR